jgi:hypothetical protein
MFYTLENSSWTASFSPLEQQNAIEALEKGKVIYLPQLSFKFEGGESGFLTPSILEVGRKNISFNLRDKVLKGAIFKEGESKGLFSALMMRFSKSSKHLLEALIPQYKNYLITGRTSYRPIEIEGRWSSVLKDDTRLHVDAFPATPNQGKRILRVFSNVNPVQKARHWHLGEPFEEVVNYFRANLHKPVLGSRKLLSLLKITKSYRTLYDHYMLVLHNQMKLSDAYQQKVNKTEMYFPAGSTWIVMTDQVSHAALSGQYVLEQTFYLPVSGMKNPEQSPLRMLEKTLNRELADCTA